MERLVRCSTRRERASGARDRESRALRVPTLAYRHHCRPPGEAARVRPACGRAVITRSASFSTCAQTRPSARDGRLPCGRVGPQRHAQGRVRRARLPLPRLAPPAARAARASALGATAARAAVARAASEASSAGTAPPRRRCVPRARAGSCERGKKRPSFFVRGDRPQLARPSPLYPRPRQTLSADPHRPHETLRRPPSRRRRPTLDLPPSVPEHPATSRAGCNGVVSPPLTHLPALTHHLQSGISSYTFLMRTSRSRWKSELKTLRALAGDARSPSSRSLTLDHW